MPNTPPARRQVGIEYPITNILVVGCSGHARVVLDILEQYKRYHVVGLIDSFKPAGTELAGYPVIATDEDLPDLVMARVADAAIVAIGDNWVRSNVVAQIRKLQRDFPFISAVHPSAQIAKNVSIGCGAVIMAGAVVNTGSRIGEFCILNTGCSLDHDSVMKDFSSLAPRAVTGGNVQIGAHSAIAIGATVVHEINIGENVVVGAGATVLKDVPDCVVTYGTPARVIRQRQPGDPYLHNASKPSTQSSPSKAPAIVSAPGSAALIPADNGEWCNYLHQAAHDFFQTAGYHEISAKFRGCEGWLAVYGCPGKFVAWPYLLQEVRTAGDLPGANLRDVTSAYGYSGPVICGCEHDQPFMRSAWLSFIEIWRAQGAISVFTRFHPLLVNQSWINRAVLEGACGAIGGTQTVGKTVAIDLTAPEQENWGAYQPRLRTTLRRARNMGVTTLHDPDWSYFDDFIRLYYSTMRRNGAAPFYFFSAEYLRAVKRALGLHGSLMITRYGGESLAAALIIEYRGIVHSYLVASDEQFSQIPGVKLLIDDTRLWSRARGNRYLHLGGGRASRDDSLLRFKSLFSNTLFPFHTGKWILNQDWYRCLSEERQRQTAALGYGLARDFFPVYRAPFVRAEGAGDKALCVAGDDIGI